MTFDDADRKNAPEATAERLEEAAPTPALTRMLEDEGAHATPTEALPPLRTEHLVGEVVDTKHPTLTGRVRVRWTDLDGHLYEKWLATLMGLPVRVGDRVLMTRPANYPERVVTGVLDGFSRRPEVERASAATLELQRDEALRVTSARGQALLEVYEDERGPVVKLLTGDVDLEMQGALRVRASAIELEATQGQAKITASDDVVVKGETVHLN
ncbi:MAG: hypothetical protein AB7S26_41470 [Sandaracinaceae bacterium]